MISNVIEFINDSLTGWQLAGLILALTVGLFPITWNAGLKTFEGGLLVRFFRTTVVNLAMSPLVFLWAAAWSRVTGWDFSWFVWYCGIFCVAQYAVQYWIWSMYKEHLDQ